MKPIAKVYTAIIFLFLFAPIAILLVFSFNSGNSLSVFSGFSLYWYKELFQDSNTLEALRNTLVLALCAAILSTVLGTAASVGMNKLRSKYMRAAMNTVTNLPMVNPEIITGISLMLMFVFVGQMMGLSTSLNFGTILIAHVTFCLPFVILQVLPKLRQMDPALPEAAMDLGRELLAVPGSILSPESRGTNYLIANGACCIIDEESIEMAISRIYGTLRYSRPDAPGIADLDPTQQAVMHALIASPLKVDDIAALVSLDAVGVLKLLGSLELEGLIERMMDGRYAPSKFALHAQTPFGHNGKRVN